MTYYLAQKGYEDTPIATTATPDAAFNLAREESKKTRYSVFLVYDWRDRSGNMNVRAYANNGSAHWAKPCTACNRSGCSYCKNIGYVEATNG